MSSFPSVALSCKRSRGRFTHGEIKSRFNSRSACHHSVHNISCYHLITKNTRTNINRNKIFLVILHGREAESLTLGGENRHMMLLGNRVLRKKL